MHTRGAPRAALLLAFLAGALLGCKGNDSNAQENAADSTEAAAPGNLALPVVGEEVRRGDLVLSVVTTGQVRAEQMAMVKSETQGTIVEVLVRTGDRVRKGQPLVKVDPTLRECSTLTCSSSSMGCSRPGRTPSR